MPPNSETSGPKVSSRIPRLTIRLELGTKICLLVGLLFFVAAVYFFGAPLSAATSNGPRFDCQSAWSPPRQNFNQNACGNVNDLFQFRAATALAGGLLFWLAGALLFGFTKSSDIQGDVDLAGDEN